MGCLCGSGGVPWCIPAGAEVDLSCSCGTNHSVKADREPQVYLLLHGFILLSNNSARVSLSDLRTNILYIQFNTSEFLLVKDILLLVPAIETVSWKCLTQQ